MLSENLKKLTYRLQYRGIKELNIFFRQIISHLAQISSAERVVLEKLINEGEYKIYAWVLGYEETPLEYKKVIEKFLTLK